MATFTPVPSSLTEHEQQLLRSEVVPELEDILEDVEDFDSVEELERMACELLLSFQALEAPPELCSALVEAVADSDAPAAPDLLAALSVLGRGEIGRAAAAAAAGKGRSRFESALGRLEPRAAAHVREGAVELLQVRFERPDSGEHQLGAVFLELEETGGAAIAGMVTAPASEPGPFLPGPDGAQPRPISLGKLVERVERALARTAELDLPVDRELGVCLPLVAVALTGSADGLPAVAVELEDDDLDGEPAPGERGPLYVDPLDEDAYMLIEQGLLDQLGEHIAESEEPASDHAEFFAESLLHWKWGYADGRLGTWTRADIAEYLLDYMPRKVSADEETIAAAPGCLAIFVRFLDARGSLAGDPLEELLAEVERLSEQVVEVARDPSNWGLAKSLVSQMEAEGVDPAAEGALDAWMEDFNARPREERDRIVGPALEHRGSIPPPAGPAPARPTRAPGPRKAERRGKRKQARAARKRNR